MKLANLKLVTIIAESVLEEKIVLLLKAHGATGHTIVASHGEGSRGMRTGEIPGQNSRIETLVSMSVADNIMKELSQSYFEHYAVICYVIDASVLRGEKYT